MKRIIFFLFAILCVSVCDAQSISGSSTVTVGQELNYSVSNGVAYMVANWIPVNGTVVTKWNVGTTYYATIRWTTPGSVTLQFRDQNYTLRASKSVTITVGVPATTFSMVKNCGSTDVVRSTSPPTGVTWYWQTSSTGTSTANGSGASINRTTTNPLFLRARAGSAWSPSSQSVGTVSIVTTTATPASSVSGSVISDSPSAINISVVPVSGATSYRWFATASGGAPIAGISTNTYTPMIAQTQTFYVEAVTGNCASLSRRDVTAFLTPEPVVNTSNQGQLSEGNSVVLSVSNFTYDTYQWLDGNDEAIVGQSGASYTSNMVGTYKVRVTKTGSLPWTSPAIQISSYNFISTANVQIDGILNESELSTLPISFVSQSTEYIDGLGRPIQSVSKQASPLGMDIVQPIVYDAFARESTKYLPFVSSQNSGAFKIDAVTGSGGYVTSKQFAFYNGGSGGAVANDAAPFAETRFMKDPLNRVLEQGSPGVVWQPDATDSYIENDETIRFAYETNLSTEVKRWTFTPATASGSLRVVWNGYYMASELLKVKTKDEHSNEVVEYKEKNGKVVLKKVQVDLSAWAETYYIYDDIGNLVVVLPPEAVNALSN